MSDEEMLAIAAPLEKKAEKIRALHKAGASTSEISRVLKIRYQHTYNVLKRAGAIVATDLTGRTASGEYFAIEVKPDGFFRLPEQALGAIGAAPGEALVCRADPDGLIVTTRAAALEGLREFLRSRAPEQVGLIDALLPNITGGSGPTQT
jgi:hypothetical protein